MRDILNTLKVNFLSMTEIEVICNMKYETFINRK